MSKKKKETTEQEEDVEAPYTYEFDDVTIEGDGESYLTDEIIKVEDELEEYKEKSEYDGYSDLPSLVRDTVALKIKGLECYLSKLRGLLDKGAIEETQEESNEEPAQEIPNAGVPPEQFGP